MAQGSTTKNASKFSSFKCRESSFLHCRPNILDAIIYTHTFVSYGRGSVVGIVGRYGLDGSRIESRWGARFSAPVQTSRGAHPAPYTIGTGIFLEGG